VADPIQSQSSLHAAILSSWCTLLVSISPIFYYEGFVEKCKFEPFCIARFLGYILLAKNKMLNSLPFRFPAFQDEVWFVGVRQFHLWSNFFDDFPETSEMTFYVVSYSHRRPAVNFINIKRTNFSYEHHISAAFSSYMYIEKWRSHKKFVRKMLIKLTPVELIDSGMIQSVTDLD